MVPCSRRCRWGALVLAVGAAALSCEPRQTDAQRIHALFTRTARAAEERKLEDVMRGVSARFEGQGLDARGLKQLLAYELLRGAWVAIRVAGERIAVDGDAATAAVDVAMVRSGEGTAVSELLPANATVYRLALRLERTGDGWRVTTAAWRPVSVEDALAGPPSASAR